MGLGWCHGTHGAVRAWERAGMSSVCVCGCVVFELLGLGVGGLLPCVFCLHKQAFKAEFDGSGTSFTPVLAAEEEPQDWEEGVGAGRRRRVLKYAEGLAHRLVLLEDD